jgi:predicted nucleotidyltransferase
VLGASFAFAEEGTVAKLKDALSRELGVACAMVFGSRARGTHRDGSDLDLAIVGRGVDRFELGARLSILLDLEIDVVDLDDANIPLLRAVVDDGVPVSSNLPGALGSFYSRALLELDFDGPLYDRMARGYLAALARGDA